MRQSLADKRALAEKANDVSTLVSICEDQEAQLDDHQPLSEAVRLPHHRDSLEQVTATALVWQYHARLVPFRLPSELSLSDLCLTVIDHTILQFAYGSKAVTFAGRWNWLFALPDVFQ